MQRGSGADWVRQSALLAGWLWVYGGVATLVSVLLPSRPGADLGTIAVIGALAVTIGTVTMRVPWWRYPPWVLQTLLTIVALVVISWHNLVAGADPYRYSIFFVATFAWLGTAAPRWVIAGVYGPLATIAYLVPLVVRGEPAWVLASAGYVVPVFVCIGELIAWQTARRDDLARRLEATACELEAANAGLREADAMKDEFVSVTTHELRTPVTAILGFAELLRRHDDQLDDARRRELLERIHGSGRRLDGLVEDLLTMSRARSRQLVAEREDVILADIVAQTLAELGDPDGVEVAVPADVAVHADPDHVARIILNLVTNADRYGRPPVLVSGRRDGDAVLLTVRDHGPGVPSAFSDRLFDRFARATSGGRGLGLGLSIVHALATANDGAVGYRPADPGASFTVRLPAAGAVPAAAEAA